MTTDTERLDFLQENHLTVFRVVEKRRKYRTTPEPSYDMEEVFLGWRVNGDDEEHPTIRAAIDSATKQEELS